MPRIDTTLVEWNAPAERHSIDVSYIGTLRPAVMCRTGTPASISGNSNVKLQPITNVTKSDRQYSRISGTSATSSPRFHTRYNGTSVRMSAPGAVTTEMVRTMNRDAILFACANPTPEIFPDEAKAGGAKVVATGRSDFPNQINNVLAFPGIFRGAFDVRASDINEAMKVAAAEALAGLISDEELNADYIIPAAFDPRVGRTVAAAVARAARDSGVARI